MPDTVHKLHEALAASDQWLQVLVEHFNLDAEGTAFNVAAVSTKDQTRRPLASSTLLHRLNANKKLLENLEN
ncbi:hypothetical protein AmDm5_1349 [Acetobacter malorum]|uniref:hypothetical protein n=1 Tax=Acetobacter persici TaxID=1076596 RepID=UPI0005009153|nr:hypothetical protein [Acetobacter persici]KFL89902.1 hypothetical protein AmDm5_1349 [Acetobacter malorum]MCG0998905.1 hypothetical protein [Acetobacter persici]